MFTRKIDCHDCGEYVWDLKKHRRDCRRSRKKSKSQKNVSFKSKKPTRSLASFTNTTDYYGLFDVSGSMYGSPLMTSKNVLAERITEMNDDDRLAVITFDSTAHFRLKPRPVGQVVRQKEIPELFNRIYAKGLTAIWDAIYLAVDQLFDKTRRTVIIVLTDGYDNSSIHTFGDVLTILQTAPGVILDIVHINNTQVSCQQYGQLCEGRGVYEQTTFQEFETTLSQRYKTRITESSTTPVTTTTATTPVTPVTATTQVTTTTATTPVTTTVTTPVTTTANTAVTTTVNTPVTTTSNTPVTTIVNTPVTVTTGDETAVMTHPNHRHCHLCSRKYKSEKKIIKHFQKDHNLTLDRSPNMGMKFNVQVISA